MVITRIAQQQRTPNRRNIFIDGRFAFACSVNVVAKFLLREGMSVMPEQVEAIKRGEVRQECMDKALGFLEMRLHSRLELARKLGRQKFAADMIDEVLEELARIGYVDDERFARTKALAAAQNKHHGRRRAFSDLMKTGVKTDVAAGALDDVYTKADSLEIARALAAKQAPRLRRLDPVVARRRLAGMLQRRGFDYDTIRPILDEVLSAPPRDEM